MKNQKITNAYKNAVGTVFLLAGAFFICSTLLSMRAVLADPIAPAQNNPARANTSRTAPGRTVANTRASARATTTRATTNGATRATANTATRTTAPSRNVSTRSVSIRNANGESTDVKTAVRNNTASRSIASRTTANNNTTMRGVSARASAQRVVARTATTPSRVSLVGTGMRASTGGVTVSYLTNKLYTGNYSNIIDSSTGLISADAYSTCLESYYTCMDEICTARSDAKGRCSCAGRATNFLAAESALEKANEELISLSGQLALLISTKGKDVSEAFKLTDAEKVMNCVSWKDLVAEYGSNYSTPEVQSWCNAHGMFNSSDCKQPDYCSERGNDFGFDISNVDGSSSDILASLKAWADAKDLAKQYTDNDTTNLLNQYATIGGVINGLSGITQDVDTSKAALDTLANKWGYELFEYAHNNVCGRVLDSCFNGIYEACGTPPSGTDSAGNKIGKCANGASTSCPYNYNSAISVTTSGNGAGEVVLNERGSSNATTSTSATCFGYSSSSGDPYATLRGPVADARRSIMQKYLLDANAACDTYGTALKNTAQNINYQKIAAEQALRQKRMEFYNEEETKIKNDAIVAVTNFNECISEIWDCYNENVDEENWSTARIKTYCAQVANVPHCYEPMICPGKVQFKKVIDVADNNNCKFSVNRDENTCRNVVTLNEILYGAAPTNGYVSDLNLDEILNGDITTSSSEIREACLLQALGCGGTNAENDASQGCLRDFKKSDYMTTNN